MLSVTICILIRLITIDLLYELIFPSMERNFSGATMGGEDVDKSHHGFGDALLSRRICFWGEHDLPNFK